MNNYDKFKQYGSISGLMYIAQLDENCIQLQDHPTHQHHWGCIVGPGAVDIRVGKKKVKMIMIPSEDDIQYDRKIPDDIDKSCCVCLDNENICVIDPCMHKCICIKCSIKLGKNKQRNTIKCPICKKGIKKIKRVY